MSSIATSSPVSPVPHAANQGRFVRVGIATVIAATVANVLVYFIGGAFVAYNAQFLPLADVVGSISFTLPAAIIAVVLYAILLRRASNPPRTFTIIAAVIFVVTLIPDFTYTPTLPGATAGQTTILVLMHVVAAAVIVRMLTTLARPQAR